jgi:nickel-dependent lactate racemase
MRRFGGAGAFACPCSSDAKEELVPSRRQFLVGSAASSALSAASAAGSAAVTLRTHEWFGDKLEQFDLPAGWHVTYYHSNGRNNPVLAPADIRKAVLNPVGTRPLCEIAAGKTTAAIAVDDVARPTPAFEVIPHLVAELNAAGLRDENILFVAAHGCHDHVNQVEMAKKIGEEAAWRHPWVNHNAWENLVDRGTTKAGNHVQADVNFCGADVRITISGLKRHGTPGYGGGPKLCLPGLSGVKTIRYMHNVVKQASRPRVDGNGVPIIHVFENEQRQDMIEAARLMGVDFSVQCCYNQDRKLVKIVSGDIVKAHHEACRFAIPANSTPYAKNADIVIANCYPRGAQLHELFSFANAGLKDGGSAVLINQYPLGELVWHYNDQVQFFQDGKQNYFQARAARKSRFSRVGQLMLYSQYLQQRELSDPAMPPDTVGCRVWQDVVERLKKKHTGSSVEVAVYPAAGLQHAVATHDIPPDA